MKILPLINKLVRRRRIRKTKQGETKLNKTNHQQTKQNKNKTNRDRNRQTDRQTDTKRQNSRPHHFQARDFTLSDSTGRGENKIPDLVLPNLT